MARRTNKMAGAQMKVRLTPELRDRIEMAAREHGVSMNAEIANRLALSFEIERRGTLEERLYRVEQELAEVRRAHGEAVEWVPSVMM